MRETIVGVIFAGAMAALGYFTIFMTDSDLGGLIGEAKKAQHVYKVVFDRVNGLEGGHKVKASGLDVGEVTYMRLLDDGRVEVTMTCWQPLTFRNDDQVWIKDVSPLGGKYVDFVSGEASETFTSPPEDLTGDVKMGLLEAGGDAVDDLRGDIQVAIKEIEATFKNLREITEQIKNGEGTIGRIYKDKELYDELLATVKDLRAFAGNLSSKDGTVSRLINDRELYDNLNSAVAKLDDIIGGVKDGKGTVGKLFNDATLHDDVQALVNEIRGAMKGDGTLGKLINDPSLYDNLNATVNEAKAIIVDARNGKGTLGKLINDESLYNDLQAALADIKAITGDLRGGKGTLGKLLTDDSAYNELKFALSELGKSLEDTREQAPINTFTSVIFSAF